MRPWTRSSLPLVEVMTCNLFRAKPLPETMMTSSNGNIFRVIGPLCGEFTVTGEFPLQRPVTRSSDVFFHLRLNEQLSKQSLGWWFEMPSPSSCRHCNECWFFAIWTPANKLVRNWNQYTEEKKIDMSSAKTLTHLARFGLYEKEMHMYMSSSKL